VRKNWTGLTGLTGLKDKMGDKAGATRRALRPFLNHVVSFFNPAFVSFFNPVNPVYKFLPPAITFLLIHS
jgi:hypothetical protein